MRRLPNPAVIVSFVALATSAVSAAPAAPPKAWVVSPMRVRELPATNYFATTRDAIYGSLAKVLPPAAEIVRKGLGEAKAEPTAGLMLVYHDATPGAAKPFKLDVGFPVVAGARNAGECTVRTMPAGRFASVLFAGPVTALGEAYGQLYREMFKAQLQPAGETRERYLQFDNSNPSSDCVILIEVALK